MQKARTVLNFGMSHGVFGFLGYWSPITRLTQLNRVNGVIGYQYFSYLYKLNILLYAKSIEDLIFGFSFFID